MSAFGNKKSPSWATADGDVVVERDTISVLADVAPSVTITSHDCAQVVSLDVAHFAELIVAAKAGALDHLFTP